MHMRAAALKEDSCRDKFTLYFEKSTKSSPNGRDHAALSFMLSDTNELRLAELQSMLERFKSRGYDPVKSQEFAGPRCLDAVACVERLGLQAKFTPVLQMYSGLVDRTMELNFLLAHADGVSEEKWFDEHAEVIETFSKRQDWTTVIANEGRWSQQNALCLFNILETQCGSRIFGCMRIKAVWDYMDAVSEGHLSALKGQVINEKSLDDVWLKVEHEAEQRNILATYEEKRIPNRMCVIMKLLNGTCCGSCMVNRTDHCRPVRSSLVIP